MSVKIAHARCDENGKYCGGRAGDQTGKEVAITSWYRRPWKMLVRANERKVAEKIARTAEECALNNNIGYDQGQRNTLLNAAKKVNYEINKINIPCECDCSSLVVVAVNSAGINVPSFSTHYMVNILKNTKKFHIIDEHEYLDLDKNLMRGDILVYPGHHTAIVITDGENIPTTIEVKEIRNKNKLNLDMVASLVIKGKYGNGNVRLKRLKSEGYTDDEIRKIQEIVNVKMKGGK